MALEIAELLAGECTPDESIMHYVRSFNLPAIDAQIIFRRAMAPLGRARPARSRPGGAGDRHGADDGDLRQRSPGRLRGPHPAGPARGDQLNGMNATPPER